MAEEQQQTAEAIKQRRKREKEAAKNAALGIEKFTVEVAGVFKPDLKRIMKAHGIDNQQDVHQRLLMNLIAADFEAQAKMLNVSRHFLCYGKGLTHYTGCLLETACRRYRRS